MSTKTTYKQTELGLIPTDWDFDNMGNLSKVNQGLQIPISDRFSEQVENSLFYITNEFLKEDSKNKYFIKNPPKSVIANKDDVLMTRTGNTGKVVTGVEGAFHNNFFKIKYDETKLNKDFLVGYLKSPRTQYSILTLSGNSTIPDLNHSDFYRIKIPLPPLAEQKKIADCLSTWDVAIEKQNALINALTQRKKALMQQLLTGKKRLPGFSDEWKEVKLGEIGEIQTGNTPSKLESENWNGEYYWCTAEDMKSKYVNNTAQKLTKKGWSLARTVKANSILVTCIASIGINAITNVECSFNQQINSITPNENFSTEFIYYLMNNSKENLLKYAGAGALPMLNKNTFSSIKFKFPTLSEQTAIAEILATADRELQLQKEKLAQLQTQKKGLMQVLLTGKKRLIN